MNQVLVLTVLCGAFLTGCGGGTESAPPAEAASKPAAVNPGEVSLPAGSPKFKQLRIEAVVTAEMPADQVTSPGKIEANPNQFSHLVLPVTGRITQVFVKLGDAVRQGQTMLTVESPDVDASISALLQSQASVTQARAMMAKAQADYDRAKDLFDHNAIAKKEVLNADALLTQSDTALQQAAASEQQARRKLEILGVKPGEVGQQVALHAPISGKVLEMSVVPGEFRNDLSQPVITIADLSTVWITSDVPESSIRMIQPGEHVEVELSAYPGEHFHGRVTRIADTVDSQTRTIKVRAEMDNRAGRLRPEMYGRIRHVDTLRKVPVVPASAVIQGENVTVVFRELRPGVFRQVPVKLGDRAGDRFAVLEGLAAGDRVVTDGGMLLKAY